MSRTQLGNEQTESFNRESCYINAHSSILCAGEKAVMVLTVSVADPLLSGLSGTFSAPGHPYMLVIRPLIGIRTHTTL